MAFEFELLRDILACPESHCALVRHGDSLVSTDPQTRRRYPILDNIPRLIVDESTVLPEVEWTEIMNQCQRDVRTGAKS